MSDVTDAKDETDVTDITTAVDRNIVDDLSGLAGPIHLADLIICLI